MATTFELPESAVNSFIAWAQKYEVRLPDPDGKGTLSGEFRAYVMRLLSEAFEAAAPPFDIDAAAEGRLKEETKVSPATLLKALRHYLANKDSGRAMYASEMAWKLLKEHQRLTLN